MMSKKIFLLTFFVSLIYNCKAQDFKKFDWLNDSIKFYIENEVLRNKGMYLSSGKYYVIAEIKSSQKRKFKKLSNENKYKLLLDSKKGFATYIMILYCYRINSMDLYFNKIDIEKWYAQIKKYNVNTINEYISW